ncbi:MAG: helix-turn-helix transcriptional regulator [Deltaproteobacteria bacterium]|nr:helix-turn-helix transcriptional regulator [Deltaproteobacteria bacterium]
MRLSKNVNEELRQADPSKLTMGQRIRLIRKDMSQTAFGKLLGKSQDAVSVYENDQITPSLEALVKIAEMGNVTVDWLFHGPSPKAQKDPEQGIVFLGHIIKPRTHEWRLLEMVVKLNNEKLKEKIIELVQSFINIERKEKVS